MDLRHLETFLKIAELRSFTKAADELCLTQPTVSKQIMDLERFFEIRLIDRTKRTVALTRAGEILLKYARDFLYLKKEAIDALADFRGLRTGTIHVGASNIPGVYILPAVLNTFKQQYSGIHIKLTVSDTKDIIERTEIGETDVGLVGARDASEKLDYRKLIDDSIVLVGPPDYPDSIHVSTLKDFPLIVRESGSGTRKNFEAALTKLHFDKGNGLFITAELSDTESIKEAVKHGMGMAYISRMAVTTEIERGTVKIIGVDGLKPLKRALYLITRKGKALLPQIKALIGTVEQWKKTMNHRHDNQWD